MAVHLQLVVDGRDVADWAICNAHNSKRIGGRSAVITSDAALITCKRCLARLGKVSGIIRKRLAKIE